MKSERTKNCGRLALLFGILHFICLFGPLMYFIPYGFYTGTEVQKISLGMTVIASIVLAVFSIVADVKHRGGLHRTIMWVLIAGVLFCLTEIKTFIWIMAITSVIDELVFVKLRNYYKTALIANKEIDKRTP